MTEPIHANPTFDTGFADDIHVVDISSCGMTAAAYDFFEVDEVLRPMIGKTSSNFNIDNHQLVKAMLCQYSETRYSTLYKTAEYYKDRPLNGLLDDDAIRITDLNRVNLARCLDAVYDARPDEMFIRVAHRALSKLGIKTEICHIDTTSFRYEGVPKSEPGCDVVIELGYSRDSHPELPQVNQVLICENTTGVPFFTKAQSGGTSDKISFRNTLIDHWEFMRQQFIDLHYIVGDSALCTSEIAAQAAAKGIYFVTRMPDSYTDAKRCLAMADTGQWEPINPDDPNSPLGMWCDNGHVGSQEVKMLMVRNPAMRDQKLDTARRKAQRESEKTLSKLKKLHAHPQKCMADAQKAIEDLQASLKFNKLENIVYEEVKKHKSRGRPAAGQDAEVVAVKVSATVSADETAIAQWVESELLYVLCTNDLKREWTMADLVGIYHRQSVVERGFKILKSKKILLDGLFLKKPSRICALMWLMSLGLLLHTATQYYLRQKMAEDQLTIPSPDGREQMPRPTMLRFIDYMKGCGVKLLWSDTQLRTSIKGLTQELRNILLALGEPWYRYYTPAHYRQYVDLMVPAEQL